MSYIVVGLGGILGSITRYLLGKLISKHNKAAFPWATFIINMLGALLLGAISAIHSSNMVYWAVGDGFLGAFTTFSTFMYEGFSLFKNNKHLNALVYIFATMILGIIGYGTGYLCVSKTVMLNVTQAILIIK